jgi:formate hydrogenlyase transcriptional activator
LIRDVHGTQRQDTVVRNNTIGRLRGSATAGGDEAQMVSRSPMLREAFTRAERVASTDATVLITGETGTGKELLARFVHRRSRRCGRPLVAVNVAALPEALVAAELFGHEPGAFTGAGQRRIGRFEAAHGGTLFLDEVGELSHDVQVALLRVLQEGEYERLGGCRTLSVDVRVLAATNRDLEADVAGGRFRADLFYRLSVFPIHLPSLRQRPEDVPDLAALFLERASKRLGRRFDAIEAASMERLRSFGWPGNVRQLENVIEQCAILDDGPVLHVPAEALAAPRAAAGAHGLAAGLQDEERRLIEKALASSRGRVSGPGGAAARLSVPASTLESKIRKLGIEKGKYRWVSKNR